MATIVKKTIRGNTYYYLVHTLRKGDKFTQKEKYLGRRVPKNVESIKKQFLSELDREKWFGEFREIRDCYKGEIESTPISARKTALREFSVRFTYNTQRIEGSTLTLRETAELLEHNVSPGGKPLGDIKEAEEHHKVFLETLEQKKDLSQQLVFDWHWKTFRQTKLDMAGKIRRHGVRITGSNYVPSSPVELQPLLNEFFDWYSGVKARANPVELAGLVHLRFVSIHPFSDGNGRISRVMMNFVLHRHGYPMLNIEYKGRAAYYRALERSQLSNDERPFMNWFFRRYRREFRTYLRR